MNFFPRKTKEIDRSKPLVRVGPDVVVEKEWSEGNFRIVIEKPGWSWAVTWPHSPKYASFIGGSADTYEEALRNAMTAAKSPEIYFPEEE